MGFWVIVVGNCETSSVLLGWDVKHSSPSICRCWRTQVSLRVKVISGLWSWAVFLWSSWRGRTQLCPARMRQSLPRIWPPTSYKDTSQNPSRPLTLWPHSLPCALQIPPHHRRTCSGPNWTHRSPSTHYCTACGRPVPLGIWTWPAGTAGARWRTPGPLHLHDHATHHPPVAPLPALPAQPPPPPPPPLMKSGKESRCLGSVFLQIAKRGQMVTRTTGHHCTNQPGGRLLHLHGSSLHPTPNMPLLMPLPLPACGLMEAL